MCIDTVSAFSTNTISIKLDVGVNFLVAFKYLQLKPLKQSVSGGIPWLPSLPHTMVDVLPHQPQPCGFVVM